MASSTADKKITEFIKDLNSTTPRKRAKREDGVIAMLELLDPLELNNLCGNDKEFRLTVDAENRRAVLKAQHLLHLVLEEMMSEERLECTNLDDLRKTADAAAKISQLLNNRPTAIAGKPDLDESSDDDITKKPHSSLTDDELAVMMKRAQDNKQRLEKNIGPVRLHKDK